MGRGMREKYTTVSIQSDRLIWPGGQLAVESMPFNNGVHLVLGVANHVFCDFPSSH